MWMRSFATPNQSDTFVQWCTMQTMPDILTTRLRLRPFTLSDAPHVYAIAGLREIADMTLSIPHPYPSGAAEDWISTHSGEWDAGVGITLAITTHDDSLVGCVGLTVAPQHRQAELGYWIAPLCWGRGYATEAAVALLTIGFDQMQLHRIQARHFVRNEASGRVMEKIGMQREGVIRDGVRKGDHFETVVLYAILATDSRVGA